jgi:hypothetical protein
MKLQMVAAASAALLLAACGSADEAAAPAADLASEAATPEPAAAAAPTGPVEAGAKPTKEFMVGKWGEDGDCTLAIDFKADGSMDGPVEKWNLEDGKLEMVGMPQRMHLTVIDDKTMESRIDGTGDPRKLTRC